MSDIKLIEQLCSVLGPASASDMDSILDKVGPQYDQIKRRMVEARNAWASISEANKFIGIFAGDVKIARCFAGLIGDLCSIYGLTHLNALAAPKMRQLPARCKVRDLIDFAMEVAYSQPSLKQSTCLALSQLLSTT